MQRDQRGDDLNRTIWRGRLNRRQLLHRSAAVGVAVGAVAATPGTRAIAQETPRFDGVTLQIRTGETFVELFNMYADEIRDLYGIELSYTTGAPQDVYQADMLDFASGQSDFDIVSFQPAWIADYAPHLADLGALAEQEGLDFHLDDALSVFRESYTSWDGKFCALPLDADQHNLYYNRTAFESEENRQAFQEEFGRELAVPNTWDEYVEVAEFFNGRDWDGDGEPEYGVAEAWLRGGYAYWWWLSKFFSNGGIYFDEEMNPLINTPSGLKALQTQLAIREFVPPGSCNFGSPESRNAFLNGEVPMVVHWTSTAKLAKDPEASQIVDDVGVALVPGTIDPATEEVYRRPSLPTGWGAGVTTYSENQEAAATVLAYYMEPERSTAIALNPLTWAEPWRISSMDPEVWLNQWPDDPEYAEQLVQVMEQTLDLGVPDLQIPGQAEYVAALDQEISSVLCGDKDPQQALDDAAAEWNNITDRMGRDQQLEYWQQQFAALQALGIEYRPELGEPSE